MKGRTHVSREYKEQIVTQVNDLRRDGATVMEATQKVGVSYTNYHRWKNELQKAEPAREIVRTNGHDEARMLRIENQRLKAIVAEQALDIQALKEYAGRRS